jgi:hypothetical protein
VIFNPRNVGFEDNSNFTAENCTGSKTSGTVSTTLHFPRNLLVCQISRNVSLQYAVNACQGETIQIIDPFLSYAKILGVVNMLPVDTQPCSRLPVLANFFHGCEKLKRQALAKTVLMRGNQLPVSATR